MDERDVCMLLGQAIKRLRNGNKWTQETLAEKLDISANFLSNLENGKAWVSPKTVSKLARIFKVQPHELFMPAYDIPSTVQDILSRYMEETKKAVVMALDELNNQYLHE